MAHGSGSSSSLSSSEGSQILESGTGLPAPRTGYARRVELVALNFSQADIPDLWVTETTQYSDLEARSQENEESNPRSPVILQQIFGPRPRWQVPVSTSKVHPSIDVLYAVDTSIEYHLALVRTPTKDFPLPLPAFPLPGTSVIAAIKSSPLFNQIELGSITLYEGDEDVRDMEYDLNKYPPSSSRPMVFCIVDKRVLNAWEFKKFKDSHDSYNGSMAQNQGMTTIPYHLRLPLIRSNILGDTAPDLPALSLPCIHLSLALRHSIISLAESVESRKITSQRGTHVCARLQRSLDQLQGIFDDISKGFAVRGNWGFFMNIQNSLDHLFYSLCEEHPGAVAIRQSFDAYQNCVELGLRASHEGLVFKREDLDNYFSSRRGLLTQITDSESPLQIDNENERGSAMDWIALDLTSAASDSMFSPLGSMFLDPDDRSSVVPTEYPLPNDEENTRAFDITETFGGQPAQWNIPQPQGSPWTATVEIARSKWILKERPLVTLGPGESDADLRLAINAMAPEELLFFSSLPIAPAFGALDPTTARFGSNSFQCGTVPMGQQDGKVYGVFRLSLGFASCCSPNVHLHWNATSGLMEYRAVRDIPVGEPLSISFDVGGLLLPHNERRTRLWQRRNIDCACFICTTPDVVDSDLRRKFVATIVQTKQQDVRLIAKAVRCLREERLYLFEDTLCYDCYRLETTASPPNIVTATYWLRDACAAACAVTGEDDPRVQHMREILASTFRNPSRPMRLRKIKREEIEMALSQIMALLESTPEIADKSTLETADRLSRSKAVITPSKSQRALSDSDL